MPTANTSVFTGADASITLAKSQGPEGDAAQKVIDGFNLLTVGRAQNVSVQVRSEIHPFNELGQRYATELRAGNVSIQGTIGRAYINGALLRLLLGEAANNRPGQSWNQPTFNITLLSQNAAVPGVQSTVTLHDVKVDNWVLNIPEDDFLMESITFQALYITVQDEAK
jgi:hypothetical protein